MSNDILVCRKNIKDSGTSSCEPGHTSVRQVPRLVFVRLIPELALQQPPKLGRHQVLHVLIYMLSSCWKRYDDWSAELSTHTIGSLGRHNASFITVT